MQPWFAVYIFDIGHPCYGTLAYSASRSVASVIDMTSPVYSATTCPLSTSVLAKAHFPAPRGSLGTSCTCATEVQRLVSY